MKRSIKNKIPETIDFSSAAIKHAVKLEISQHPLTVYSGMAAVLCVIYQLLFGSSTLLSGILIFSFSLGLIALVVNKYFRKELFEKKYIKRMRYLLHKNMELALTELKVELIKFDCTEGAQQIVALKDKFDSLVSVLQKKLDPSSLAYSRFLGMAEQVYKNGLDNLQQIVAYLDSISPVDPGEITVKLNKLKEINSSDPKIIEEITALSDTLKMRDDRLLIIDKLLHENVKAMARLDQTAMEISTIDISTKRANTQMEDAMNELLYLADQFRNFKAD
jgi:hypothetical protein